MHAQSLRATCPKSWGRAYISGKSYAPMLQVTNITSGTLKVCPNLQITALPIYITMNSELWWWDFYFDGSMTFIQCTVAVTIMSFFKTIFTRKLALRNREMVRSRNSRYYSTFCIVQETHFSVLLYSNYCHASNSL